MDSDTTILPTNSKSPTAELRRRHRRRCHCVCLLATAGVLLLLGVTLLVLFLTVLRIRDPTTRLISSNMTSFVPSPPPNFGFNITLLLTVGVHNPNPASFSYESGAAQLWYRGVQVGDADVEPGRIPSKGDGTMDLEMTVMSTSFGKTLAQLIKDMQAGAVPLDASARLPGKVGLFGMFKLHAVAYSDCHVVFGVPEMKVRSQVCQDHTKL